MMVGNDVMTSATKQTVQSLAYVYMYKWMNGKCLPFEEKQFYWSASHAEQSGKHSTSVCFTFCIIIYTYFKSCKNNFLNGTKVPFPEHLGLLSKRQYSRCWHRSHNFWYLPTKFNFNMEDFYVFHFVLLFWENWFVTDLIYFVSKVNQIFTYGREAIMATKLFYKHQNCCSFYAKTNRNGLLFNFN